MDEKEGLSSDTSYTVSSYSELVTTINDIKTSGSSEYNYTINLDNTVDESNYYVTSPITWANATSSARNLTINGNGVTINGTNTTQFMNVSSGYTLTLTNITIANCYNDSNGGAIFNSGTLTLNNVTFRDNSATSGGAIYTNNGGTINANNSIFTNNG